MPDKWNMVYAQSSQEELRAFAEECGLAPDLGADKAALWNLLLKGDHIEPEVRVHKPEAQAGVWRRRQGPYSLYGRDPFGF